MTIVPSITDVSRPSTIDECGLEMMSVETIGSSVYWRIPFSGPSAAERRASLTSSLVVSLDASKVRSTTEPVATGARMAKPCSLPLSSGRTRPTAFAAPVDVGMRFSAAAQLGQRRQRRPDAGVVRDAAVVDGDVEVDPGDDALAAQAPQIVERSQMSFWTRSTQRLE